MELVCSELLLKGLVLAEDAGTLFFGSPWQDVQRDPSIQGGLPQAQPLLTGTFGFSEDIHLILPVPILGSS